MSFAARFARNLTVSRGFASRAAVARPALNVHAALRMQRPAPLMIRQYSSAHDEETFEEFTARYV